MKYGDLLLIAGQQPFIETATLVALGEKPASLAVQLSRWVEAGKLLQLRRGLYILPDPLRRDDLPVARLANLMLRPSYGSLEYALALHGIIPETVHLVQSVTTRRPAAYHTPVGDFQYHRLHQRWFFGYAEIEVPGGRALLARPEKALLDLCHLASGEWSRERLDELRLQNLELIDIEVLENMAKRTHSPRAVRVAATLAELVLEERALTGERR